MTAKRTAGMTDASEDPSDHQGDDRSKVDKVGGGRCRPASHEIPDATSVADRGEADDAEADRHRDARRVHGVECRGHRDDRCDPDGREDEAHRQRDRQDGPPSPERHRGERRTSEEDDAGGDRAGRVSLRRRVAGPEEDRHREDDGSGFVPAVCEQCGDGRQDESDHGERDRPLQLLDLGRLDARPFAAVRSSCRQ